MRLASAAWTVAMLAAAFAASAEPMLRGRVTSWDGKPGAGIRVDVVDVASDFEISPLPGAKFLDRALGSATTGADGTFAIEGATVPAGLLSLTLTPPGGAPLLLDGERIAFGPSALPQDLVLVIPPLVACEGVVLDPAGAPAPGVRVGVAVDGVLANTMGTVTTDAGGAFRIDGLPFPGTLLLCARRGDETCFGVVRLPMTGSVRQALHLERAVETRGKLVISGKKPTPLAGVPILVTAIPVPVDAATDLDDTDGILPIVTNGMRISPIVIARTTTDAEGAYAVRAPAGSAILPWTPTLRAAPVGGAALTRVPPRVGRAISGGLPVAGARMRLGGSEVTTVSEADGTFAVPPADRAIWTGVAPWGEIVQGESADLAPVVRFAGSRRIVGRVVEPARDGETEPRPVPGGTVRIAARGQRPVATATDGAGAFALAIPGEITSVATCALGWCAIVEDVPDVAHVVTLSLEPPRVLAGSVTSNGSALAGALVIATPKDLAGADVSVLTDAAGRFLVPGLPRGEWRCRIFEGRHAPAEVSRSATPADRPSGEPVSLRRLGRLRVRCLDAEGRPVANVRVSADQRSARTPFVESDPDGPAILPTAGSGADGIALLDRLVTGACATIHARRPGFASAREECATATSEGAAVDIILAPPASIAGFVRDAEGAAVAGAFITASADATTASADRPSWLARPVAIATTDETGAWTLRDLAAGRLEVVAEAPGFLRTAPVPIDLAVSQRIEGVELVLDRGASLDGDVSTAKGEPVEGASVRASIPYGRPGAGDATPREAVTDAQGRFRLDALPRQELEVDASFLDERAEPRMIVPAGEPIHLVLRSGGRIEGKVVGAELMLDEVNVTCRGAPAGNAWVFVDADSRFAMGGLPAATYTCAATCDDGEGKAEGMVVREGEVTTATITLGPRRMLEVIVVDAATGAGIAGAMVRGGAAAHGPGFESTGDDGHVRIPLSPFDTLAEVRASASGYASSRRTIPSPAPASMELRLDRASKLRGRVVDAEGLPAVGARAGLGSWLGEEVDGAGAFEIDLAGRTGRGMVKATRERGGLVERGSLEVDLSADGLDGILVQLEPVLLGSVLVTVRDGDAPAVRANVQLVHESDSGRKDVRRAGDSGTRTVSGVTDEEGSFLGEGLLPGQITVLAGRESEATLRRVGSVTLSPPARAEASVTLVGGWTVTGRVVRAGAAVEAAEAGAMEISSDGRERGMLGFTLSGPDGAFTIGPLPESIVRVRLYAHAGSAPQPGDTRPLAEIDRGAQGVVLDLAGVAITGRVVASGAPAGDVEVRAVPLDGTRGGASARTSPDGTFTLGGCRASTRYSVDARPAGIPAASIVVTTAAQGSIDAGTIEIRSDELTGTARAASGAPIGEFRLLLARPDEARIGQLTVEVEPGGAWHVRAPAAEPLLFRAWAPPHAPVLGGTVPGVPLTLAFPRAGELELTVLRSDGRPAPAASVRVVSWNSRVADEHLIPSVLPGVAGTRADTTDDLGRLLASPLAAGEYVLEIWRDDLQPARASVTLAEGERKSLSVTLDPR